MTAAPVGDRRRILAVADTDSYVKWGAALVAGMPEPWHPELFVLDTPVTVSDAQLAAALAGSGMDAASVARGTFDDLRARLAADAPDAVLVSARGPLARVLAREVATLAPTAVIVTGLPGIAIPATRKALVFRAQCDLFVVHSERERAEFVQRARGAGLVLRFALATLPFAATPARDASCRTTATAPDAPERGTDLVFAAQAIVPSSREDRLRVAELLVRAARADSSRRVVVKLRGVAGEHQTHAEPHPLPGLLDEVAAAERAPLPANLVQSTEPMRDALVRAEGLVTVSSTAAIEALALGLPVIALDTFGVSPQLINEVFEGSGLLAGADAVIARTWRHPEPQWLRDNYLHDADAADWTRRLEDLVDRRHSGHLPGRPPLRRLGGRLRQTWERKLVLGRFDRSLGGAVAFMIGMPARAAVRWFRRLRRRLTGPDTAASQAV